MPAPQRPDNMRRTFNRKRRHSEDGDAAPVALPPETFNPDYLSSLDARLAASEALCAVTLEGRSGALFFHAESGKFTFVEKLGEAQEAHIFDCVQREQWERQVMVFGHETATGGFIASGHGTLTGNKLAVRLANGRYYRFEVDPTLPPLAPFYVAPEEARERAPVSKRNEPRNDQRKKQDKEPRDGQARPPRNRDNVVNLPKAPLDRSDDDHDESEDLTEEDLRRLRGEIPMEARRKKSRR